MHRSIASRRRGYGCACGRQAHRRCSRRGMHGSATRHAGSLHLLRDFSQIAHTAAGHSESSGAAANFRPVLNLTHRARRRNAVDQQGPSRGGGRSGCAEGLGSVHDPGARVPSRPGASRLPEPTVGVEVGPGSIAIGRPAPGISGDTQAYPAPGYHIQAPFMKGSQPAPTR